MVNLPTTEEEFRARLQNHIDTVRARLGNLFSALVMPDLVSSSLANCATELIFTANETHRGQDGMMAPGLIAAMFDNSLGMLSISKTGPGTFTPTVDLHVNYYEGVPIGVPLRLCVQQERLTDRYVFLSGRLARQDAPETILATATASFFIIH